MKKYAKIKDNSLEYAPRNKGNISNWINDEKAVLAEGYLPVELQEIPEGKYQVGYEVVNNVIVRKLEDRPQPTEQELKELRVAELKQMLADTDYIVIKLAEDVASRTEYANELAQRAEWRKEINELETTLVENATDTVIE